MGRPRKVKPVKDAWRTCEKCGGNGCDACGQLGRILNGGFELCSICEGFGTIGYDPDDPLDCGSFQEVCDCCGGAGAVKKKD